MNKDLQQIINIVRQAGDIMLNADRTSIQIDSKTGSANFVTEYDKKVESFLKSELLTAIPDAVFVGEEGEEKNYSLEGKCFIVDPIDGTTNFIKDYHMSCISVGLLEDGIPSLAVIYNPYLDEMYYAKKGEGAFCNGAPIHVSSQPLSNGIVLFGTSPYNVELNEKSFKMAFDYFKKALDIRRSGSAALDLCAIASGRAELYFELILSPWDYAAGALIVTEAGGVVTTIEGEPIVFNRPCSVLARNSLTV